ncbi:MAG TPA: GTP cyclohydrolase I [Pyrinomonadaceae bacterium]|nr:GTP cyclohydrolase I [Pyrinomonadaceae bacterium]
MERSIHHFLLASGVNLEDPHLLETPRRVATAYHEELLSGYRMVPEDLFKAFREEVSEQTVMLRDIPFYSLCAHHLLPFFGTASIAYRPNGRVLGLSKMGRLVDCFARRLQIQERMTCQIADSINANLKPKGLVVLLQAEHMCMSMRGIRHLTTKTVSYVARGELESDRDACDRIIKQMLNRA